MLSPSISTLSRSPLFPDYVHCISQWIVLSPLRSGATYPFCVSHPKTLHDGVPSCLCYCKANFFSPRKQHSTSYIPDIDEGTHLTWFQTMPGGKRHGSENRCEGAVDSKDVMVLAMVVRGVKFIRSFKQRSQWVCLLEDDGELRKLIQKWGRICHVSKPPILGAGFSPINPKRRTIKWAIYDKNQEKGVGCTELN